MSETFDLPNRSQSIAALSSALAKAQGEMEGASKDSTNPHFKSKYADLASVWDACRKPLAKNGLAVLQPVTAEGNAVTVTTILAHCSGEWISESLTMTAQQATPQAVGSTITYGRRYGLSSMVGIAPDDDDGEAATARGFSQPTAVPVRPSDHAALPGVSGREGEIGPVMLASVKPGRAGAQAELVLASGESYLTFKQPLKVKAEASIKNHETVLLGLKKSTSGNIYVDTLTPTGMSPDDIEATKFTPDEHHEMLKESEIPF